MRTPRIIKEYKMTAILGNRMAVILYSTRKLSLCLESLFSYTCCQQYPKRGDLYNLLQKRNYFSATLAKWPVALVIRTEGKTSPFSLVAETEETIKSLEMQIQTAQAELQERLDSADIVRQEYAQLVSWADMYDHCTFEEFQNLYLAKGVSV